MSIFTDKQRAELTNEFLLCVSYHLSRNRVVSHDEYIVAIGIRDADVPLSMNCIECVDEYVFINTSVECCHHVNRRRTGVRLPALHHVISGHFSNYFANADGNAVMLIGQVFERGVYQYKRSVTGKSRRWFRVR